jgi:beta-fructofuranosidase
MQMPGGRRIVWGWVKGFPGGRGWNGCLSLPRLLSILPDGQLRQQPAPQLRKLRGELVEWRDVQLKQGSETLTLPPTNTVEIQMEIDLQSAANFELRFQSRATDVKSIVLNVRKDELRLDNVVAPLEFSNDDRRLTLNIFFDRSVMEVFANETVCITKVITPLDGNSVMVLRADGENAKAERIQVWPMNTIW